MPRSHDLNRVERNTEARRIRNHKIIVNTVDRDGFQEGTDWQVLEGLKNSDLRCKHITRLAQMPLHGAMQRFNERHRDHNARL
jgi:hypothetical protein